MDSKADMEGWEELVVSHIQFQKYNEALSVCDKHIETNGISPKALTVKSLIHLKKLEYDLALSYIEKALKIASITEAEKEKAVELKGMIFWEMGRLGDAVKHFEDNSSRYSEIASKAEELKKQYKEEYGLEYGDSTMKKIEIFINWMIKNGAKFNKIRMKYYGPDYRGVHAIKTILSNELFLRVPKHLIITPQMGRETEIGAKVMKSGVKLSWDYLIYITIFLLVQFYDEKSTWKPYIDVYPKNVDNFPMFYNSAEKALLKGTPMIDQVESEVKDIREEYDQIVEKVPEFSKFSFEDYIKNKTLVISRIFYVKMHGVNERIMVPLADMFNHHYETVGQTFWKYEDSDDSFTVKALKEVPTGDPICENYGQKPNYRFLFYYGFLIEKNRKNCVYIKLRITDSDPLIAIKEKLVGISHGSHIKTFKFFENFKENEKANFKFIGYLRFVVYEGDLNDLREYLAPQVADVKLCKSSRRKVKVPPLTIENEVKALIKLEEIAKKCLSKFAESYVDDLKLLEEGKNTMSFNTRNCLIYRAGEKKIYHQMIRMAKLGIASLTKGCEESEIEPEYACYFAKTISFLKTKFS